MIGIYELVLNIHFDSSKKNYPPHQKISNKYRFFELNFSSSYFSQKVKTKLYSIKNNALLLYYSILKLNKIISL